MENRKCHLIESGQLTYDFVDQPADTSSGLKGIRLIDQSQSFSKAEDATALATQLIAHCLRCYSGSCRPLAEAIQKNGKWYPSVRPGSQDIVNRQGV